MSWDDIAAALDDWLAAVLEAAPGAEVQRARAAFLAETGEPLVEESVVDLRDQAFFEWFAFDWPDSPAATIERPAPLAGLEAAPVFAGLVKPAGDDKLKVRIWPRDTKGAISVASSAGVQKNSALVGRVLRIDGVDWLAPSAETIAAPLAAVFRRKVLWLADDHTTERDIWAQSMRFLLMARRYSRAEPEELVERWFALEEQRGDS